ncbi:CaiB/BaiF CoA transferase family protein [Chitinophaga alhagiae]|uniref:CaiB/BaiF CoA transferase family protein n=1 Tax=Chitinophaga alhagiae TaxID=2203219 RepID=UPI000E5C4412|nr:CaiB/BaiF CoA-transferase family protein [Chitinophaga alhagiae]
MSNLLEDVLVLDFSQFLSGPSASLRLADMGARVIKIEKPGTGDICRMLYVSDVKLDGGESTIFHAINRNKESYTADLKEEASLEAVRKLVARADVMLHNFRPGVMERIGLNYERVKEINSAIIYGEISGYGQEGIWKDLPGQDLLLQAVSGLTYLTGSQEHPPVPMGVAAADIIAGTHLGQGVLAALLQRYQSGRGALVQVSMLESLLDFQFEVLTCYLNDGHQLPERSAVNGAHAYIAAPYGIYRTADGYLAIAMAPVPRLGELLGAEALCRYTQPGDWFTRRDEIKRILKEVLLQKSTQEWLAVLEPADVWCADVSTYHDLERHEGYRLLEMEQWVTSGGKKIKTTRCPVRVNGQLLTSEKGAPLLGEDNERIAREFNL